jgi:hypothetical protein
VQALAFFHPMKKTGQIVLSTKGLQIADRVSRKDFRFICGSDTLICDRFQAAFISPRIANCLLSDPSIEEYSMDHTDSRGLEILGKLICGDSISITAANSDIFVGLIEDVGNAELSSAVLDFVEENEELSVSNCISWMKRRLSLGVGLDREICFIGSHISEFGLDKLRSIDVGTMSDILKSGSLRVLSEDWLLELIFELGPLHLKLIGEVEFAYLSCRGIDLFFERISISELDERIWHQLWLRSRHRIVYDPAELVRNVNRYPGFVTRSPDSPWSGLIAHLTELCGGNVHAKGAVNITCSSTARNQCWDVVNYAWNDYWYAYNSQNNWIQFDFKDRVVSITHYTLKSDGQGGHHLLEWAVQGSMDGLSWADLDRRHTQELNSDYVTKIFSCDATFSQPHFYRCIRLLQTGKSSSGNDYLMLANFECFGSMVNAPAIASRSDGNVTDS